jgi:ABC-type transporter Mla maintaining outer membrane lipid asymmetry ATPase subunit MlaF
MNGPATASDTAAIEMTGLALASQLQPDQIVLEDVNWSVHAGEYWVLGGMHGSGKSDFLAMTAGLTPPLRGSYRLFGRPMPVTGDQFLSERLRIGLVFDGGQLFHQLTIRENVALPLRYHRELAGGDLDKCIHLMLEATGLSSLADRLPGTVGRGWQKRAGLARALVLQPDVLLLDNPLGGLDSRHQQWWLEALHQLSAGHVFQEGRPKTLVVATEDLRPWRNHAANYALLQQRRFCPLGHQEDLASLEDPLVKELLAQKAPPS